MVVAATRIVEAGLPVPAVSAIEDVVIESVRGAGGPFVGARIVAGRIPYAVPHGRLAVRIVRIAFHHRPVGGVHEGCDVHIGVVGVVERIVAFLRAAREVAVAVPIPPADDRGVYILNAPEPLDFCRSRQGFLRLVSAVALFQTLPGLVVIVIGAIPVVAVRDEFGDAPADLTET